MLLNEMDFKLNFFAPKVSSYFGVKLDQKLGFFCIFNLIMKIIKLNSFSIFNLIM